MKKKGIIFFCVFFVFVICGCNKNISENDQNAFIVSQEPITEAESSTSQSDEDEPLNSTENEPFAAAKEINRGGEDYDYGTWVLSGALPDSGLYVDKDWTLSSLTHGGVWRDSRNRYAELTYMWLIDVTLPPKEAIWKDYGTIIEKGGDVEYGEFKSKYLTQAYYCKYIAEWYIHINLYCFHYPEDIKLNQEQYIISLSYKNRADQEYSEATLNEDAFWKVAQSMFTVKGYGEGGEYIPYIPAIDGANTWDGSNQGVVPTE